MATTRKTFTAEFKLDAILDPHTSTFLIPGVHLTGGIADGLGSLKLAKTNSNIEETARNLGIGSGALHRWIRQQKQHEAEGRPAFTGYGKPALTEQEARIRQLERELDVARQERDILKKAVAWGVLIFLCKRQPAKITFQPNDQRTQS